MTPFALLLQISGLSQREAADYLSASPSSIDKMARGARSCPAGIITEMRDLIERQDAAAEEALRLIEARSPPEIEIGYPVDDYEAQALGWPCIGAWRGMAARIVASVDAPVTLAPRGATPGTARAADEHGA